MKKVITTSILLLLFSPLYAHDSERIDQLEQRVLKLESLLNSSPAKAETITSSSEGWKSIANWRKIETGMAYKDVRNILGEPARISGGIITQWYYENDGSVFFLQDKVDGWTEPR